MRLQDYQDVADAGDMPTLEGRLVKFAHELGFGIISGALVVEQVFTWPGVGQFTYAAARAKDYPVIMAGVMVASTSQACSSCCWIRDTRLSILKEGSRSSRRTQSIAAVSSCRHSFIHNSDT